MSHVNRLAKDDADLYYWEGVDILIHRGKFQTGLQSFTTHPDGGVGIVDVCVTWWVRRKFSIRFRA